MAAPITANTGSLILSGKDVHLRYTPRQLPANTGIFELAGLDATLTLRRKISPLPGSFTLLGKYSSLIYSNQQVQLMDTLAATAPAVQDFFVPQMSWSQPTAVLSLDEKFGESSSYTYKNEFLNFYDQETNVWNDQAYSQEFMGAEIPITAKQDIADQRTLYLQYTDLNEQWLTEYASEKVLQWPYYWAIQLIARRGLY